MGSGKHYLEKELYDKLQRDASLFEFLQLGSLDGIWYWDLEYPEVEWMSPEFWMLLGFDPGEKAHLASEWQSLINEEDLALARENLERHCQDPNHPYDQVVRYQHRDGSTVWVRCRGIAIRDEKGKAIRMLGAHNDITALKKTEEALRRKTEALEAANARLKETINGILPICSACKKIRDDEGSWRQIEAYISAHSDAEFSHGICDDCFERLYSDLIPRTGF